MNQQILATLTAVHAEQDETKRKELQARSNAALAAHFSHPANTADLEELAFDLLNITWADVMEQDIVNQLIEVKTVGLGDPDYVNEDLRGMRAYWQGKGGEIFSDVLRYERATMPKEELVAAIDLHADEIKLDFWGQFDKLVTQAREKLSQLPTERLIALVRTGIAASPYFGQFAGSTLTDVQVDSILDAVSARSKGRVSIVGTEVALRKLAIVGLDYGPNIQEQIFRTGQIANYKGKPVVQVEQFEDFAGNLVLPDDELWLVGQNSGRLTYYGAEAKVQILKLPAFYQRWETARDAGMLLYGASKGRIGRIKLT
jgi:hypothetical protein